MSVATMENPRLAELAEMNMLEHDPFKTCVKVNFNGNVFDLRYREFSLEVYSIFRSGYCAFLALALHELTSLPLAVFTIPDSQVGDWRGHVALKVGEDKYLDIGGITSESAINRVYGYGQGRGRPAMEVSIGKNLSDVPDIFDWSILHDPWVMFDEFEELIIRDYAEQLVAKYL